MTYAHMCRDGHPEVGYNESSEDERCPVCCTRDLLRASLRAAEEERDEARAEVAKALCPAPDAYPCDRCGRRTGMDAVMPHAQWARVSKGRLLPSGEVVDGEWRVLCLWCIEARCAEENMEVEVAIHYAGARAHGNTNAGNDYCLLAATRAHLKAEAAEERAQRLRGALEPFMDLCVGCLTPMESHVAGPPCPPSRPGTIYNTAPVWKMIMAARAIYKAALAREGEAR